MSKIPKEKDGTKLPWNHPGMVICSGRYYYGMFMLPFARMPNNGSNGGNITGMLWRFDGTPNNWVLTFRYRYYASKNNGAWDDRDRKSWYAMRAPGAEEEISRKLNELMTGFSLLGMRVFHALPLPMDWFLIQGDSEKAHDLLTTKPPHWMHSRKIEMRDDGKEPSKITTTLTDKPNQ